MEQEQEAAAPPVTLSQPGDEASTEENNEEERTPEEEAAKEVTNDAEESTISIVRYTKEFIMHLKNAPLSQQRPHVADKSLSCLKHPDKKRSDNLDEDKNGTINEKRRPGDPKERLRKESEGIVLSPQRRSFNSGCHIVSTGNGTSAAGNRDVLDNPIFLQGPDPVSKPDIGTRNLRSGSGRMASREGMWERGGDPDDYLYRPPGATRDRDERYERRSYGRDLYNEKNHRDRDSDGRYDRKDNYRDEGKRNRYGRRTSEKEEQPEWFCAGPTSQHDTIELRGFDDPEPTPPPTSKNADKTDNNGNSTETKAAESNANVKTQPKRRTAGSGRTPSAIAASQAKEQPPITEAEKETSGKESNMTDDDRINKKQSSDMMNKMESNSGTDVLEAFFKMDNFPGFVMGGENEETLAEGSRFSRWFKRDSPPATMMMNQAPQNVNIKESLFPNMPKDPSISVFTNESNIFAPISPQHPTDNAGSNSSTSNPLLEMLCRVPKSNNHGQQQQAQFMKNIENIPGKMHSLEELEARMRNMPPTQHHPNMQQMHQQMPLRPPVQNSHHNYQPPLDDEVSKFQRMMAQASGNFPMSNSGNIPKQHMQQQQFNILQMLNKSQKQDQPISMDQQQMQNHQMPMSHDLLCKLLQPQQNQDSNKMMHHSGRHFQMSPIPNENQGFANNLQSSRDLMQRPEAQAIIQGLRQGEITPQNLMQQLGNPGLQSRHREILGTILKFAQQQQVIQPATSPRNSSHRLILPTQQLRLSPLPPNPYCVSPIMATSPNTLAVHHPAMPPRIPSPRELQAHTQSIMQGALIKKKLEEQRENFRRRQEAAAPQNQAIPRSSTPSSSSPNKHQSNALGFTPTSVLRKMTAEKESDPTITSGAKAAGWGVPPSQVQQAPGPKQGRPIVKASSGSSMQQAQYPQMSNDFSSQYQNPLQQHQSQLFNNIPQGRPIRPAGASGNNSLSSFSHGGHMPMSIPLQRQQQQNMFHQHMQGNRSHIPGGTASSPTSNQLARWFSPELLAQATAGKLPSVNLGQNVLSLEELERMQHNEAIVHN